MSRAYPSQDVRRTQVYLDETQDAELERRAKSSGRSKSAVVREALDVYLDVREPDGGALDGFREAVRAAAGIAPYLPSGQEYVEHLRLGDEDREDRLRARRA